jgi:hypothetical protein
MLSNFWSWVESDTQGRKTMGPGANYRSIEEGQP